MRIVLTPGSDVPPFEQVKEQITAQVSSGELPAGTRLPTVRALAGELGLAANTVAKAYRSLEASGVVETRGRRGTYAAGAGVRSVARSEAVSFVASMRSMGLSDADVLLLVERALR